MTHFTYENISLFFPKARVVQQNRSHEDFLVSYRFSAGEDVKGEFHAVFDGHGGGNKQNAELNGQHVGLYLEKYLVRHLLYHLDGVAYDDFTNIEAKIVDAFAEVDKHLYTSGAASGSTCACLFLLPETVIVCNLGDSQIYGFRDGRVRFTSTPHVATSEVARIERCGGYVSKRRLNGIYLPSRGFGDFRVKTADGAYQLEAPMGIVPDITFLPRSDYDFFLLMSDGIVDGISSVMELERVVGAASSRAAVPRQLANIAARSNGEDDICCLLQSM